MIRKPTLVFGVADGPANLFGFNALGIELQLLGHDFFDQALGVGLVVDRELLGPAEALGIFELVDVEAQQAREQGVEGADPQLLDHLALNAGAQLPLLHRRQGAPGLAELALSQLLGQQQLQPLFHLPRGLVGEGHRQDLGRISPVLANEVSDAMGECARLAAAGASHHQQRTFVVIHRPALGVVEAGEEAHAARLSISRSCQ